MLTTSSKKPAVQATQFNQQRDNDNQKRGMIHPTKREKPESVLLMPGIFGCPQPKLDEHILFVLHPMWAEKGDLL